ncbi:hypothetical protein AKJ09_02898 [Labilithrix luteola]|uniref:Uncharacterized protein n=1 Tax=Labilithrix luteola TaxID=1391654 RepID=A0A0K1PSZ7_9BACT|nr:hypothetical protein [Labilithrix luteola]AKU96234.1 hypothetical protein AKJ09_02898 [Labilithrix luteola]
MLQINIELQEAATGILGAAPKAAQLRPQIEKELPYFDLSQLDKLVTYARAMTFAQTNYLGASTRSEQLPALIERGVAARELLLSDATALAHRGLLDGKKLTELKGSVGYLNLASDLGVLVTILRERWTDIANRTAIQPSELDDAERLFGEITEAVAARNAQPAKVASAGEERQRAFTLAIAAYDSVRRAVNYLRWPQGDADKYAPTLFANRGSRSSAHKDEPVQPIASPAQPNNPVVPQIATTPIAPGMPGASPFVDS